MALPKDKRLKRKKDFERVFKKGRAVKGNFLFAKYMENGLGFPRFAFIVSSKVAKSAVARNRVRRVLSEISRPYLKTTHPADIVLIADKRTVEAGPAQLKKDIENILGKMS